MVGGLVASRFGGGVAMLHTVTDLIRAANERAGQE